MARKKRRRTAPKKTKKSTSFWSLGSRRRSKQDQARLQRELIAVALIVFGVATLVLMYKAEGQASYGLRQLLIGTFGLGSWFVAFASFYAASVILLPSKFWQKTRRITWTAVIAVMLLGLLELPMASGPEAAFSVEQTRGGIVGYGLAALLSGLFGGFLAAVIQITLILVGFLMLTDLSLSWVATQLYPFAQAVRGWLKQQAKHGWEGLKGLLLAEDDAPKDRATPGVVRHPTPSEPEPTSEQEDTPRFTQRNLKPEPPSQPKPPEEPVPEPPKRDTSSGAPPVWFTPPVSLFARMDAIAGEQTDPEERARLIEKTLDSFGVQARVVEANVGPTITQYALELAEGVKVSKITALQNDLALALATAQLRIEAPIPGKPYVGIEVPNYVSATVTLRGLLESGEFNSPKAVLPIAVGRNVSGDVFVAELGRMPHLLIAGATGSGKSVAINAILSSFIYKYDPTQLRMILVDPKVVELSRYNGIPHLLTQVITSAKKTLSSLKWAVDEMERRYQILAKHGARDLLSYNQKQDELTRLPYVVIVIDELADLMMASPVEVEASIIRLAQKARAVGIHLILATQRPSVNVVTGLIKANIPTRMCFAVASQMDSRVVLDTNGAEKLLGRGDMLYSTPEMGKLIRLQGVFVSDEEVGKLVDFWSKQGDPNYVEAVTAQDVNTGSSSAELDEEDDLIEDAFYEVIKEDRASASLLQRRLRVGYARAARLIDILEAMGVVGPADGSKPRDILRRTLPGKEDGESAPQAKATALTGAAAIQDDVHDPDIDEPDEDDLFDAFR